MFLLAVAEAVAEAVAVAVAVANPRRPLDEMEALDAAAVDRKLMVVAVIIVV